MPFTPGIDYGGNCVRAILVDCPNEWNPGRCAVNYPSGHTDFHSAEPATTSLRPIRYRPTAEHQAVYNQLYALWRQPHDALGGLIRSADLSRARKDLIGIKEVPAAL